MKNFNDMPKFDNHKFRCSLLGELMRDVKFGLTEPQEKKFSGYEKRYHGEGKPLTKNQKLNFFELGAKKHGKSNNFTQTTISFLWEIYRDIVYNRETEIPSKFLKKGNAAQEKVTTLYSKMIGRPLLTYKGERLENEYISGMPDCLDGKKEVDDFKASWNYKTFPFNATKPPDKNNEWQVRGYMELSKIKKGKIIYGLVDTPANLINNKIWNIHKEQNIINDDGTVKDYGIEQVVKVVSNHIYTHEGLENFCNQSLNVYIEWFKGFKEVPESLRIKTFQFEHDKVKIESAYERIIKAREILNGFL